MTTPDQPTRRRAHASDAPVHEPFETPENRLGVVVAPDSIDPSRRASPRTALIAVIAMPLFFLIAFTLCFVSATHAPTPHHLALTIAGPAQVTERIAEAIQDRAEGAFTITETTNTDAARDAVASRDAVGALIVDGQDVTTVIASGGGRVAVTVVEGVGAQVAAQLGGTATVEDAAPLPGDDPTGGVLFFFLIVCTVGGFLTITVMTQALPRARTRTLLATAFGAAVVIPILAFSMISTIVDFAVPFGTVAGVLGVAMIYTLTVGLLSVAFATFLGQASIFAQILFLVALNFPSAGSSAPESMLPPFWQVVHNGWLGSGGFEAFRSIMYFPEADPWRWIAQLLIWAVGALVLAIGAAVLSRARAARRAQAGAVAGSPAAPTPDDAPQEREPIVAL